MTVETLGVKGGDVSSLLLGMETNLESAREDMGALVQVLVHGSEVLGSHGTGRAEKLK